MPRSAGLAEALIKDRPISAHRLIPASFIYARLLELRVPIRFRDSWLCQRQGERLRSLMGNGLDTFGLQTFIVQSFSSSITFATRCKHTRLRQGLFEYRVCAGFNLDVYTGRSEIYIRLALYSFRYVHWNSTLLLVASVVCSSVFIPDWIDTFYRQFTFFDAECFCSAVFF